MTWKPTGPDLVEFVDREPFPYLVDLTRVKRSIHAAIIELDFKRCNFTRRTSDLIKNYIPY